ncbi:MAG: hypothetical protein AAF939_02840 [Planctomycetota bacterium]
MIKFKFNLLSIFVVILLFGLIIGWTVDHRQKSARIKQLEEKIAEAESPSKQMVLQLEFQRQQLMQSYSSNHPKVMKIENEIAKYSQSMGD